MRLRLTRRNFLATCTTAAAGASLLTPGIGTSRADASLPLGAPDDLIQLNSNENPYGLTPKAKEAMTQSASIASRYPDGQEDETRGAIARHHGVPTARLVLGCGSSDILRMADAAFLGSGKNVVAAEPTFEAVLLHANAVGDKAVLVPLTSDHRHDLPRMLAAAPAGGLIYVCNPNNPTATVTPKAEVRDFLARVPRATMVLIDEAYYHYAESADYESVIPLVREHPNLVVARTFSKIYGMAGVRCGYAVAAAPAIERLHRHQAFNNLNILAVAGARESLKDAGHVARVRRINQAVRGAAVAELEGMGYRVLPSQANFFLVDLRRPAAPVIAALRDRGVAVGRPFAAVPTSLRVTVGTTDQMRAFGAAFRTVMA